MANHKLLSKYGKVLIQTTMFSWRRGRVKLAPARLSLPARIYTNGGQTSECSAAFSGDEWSIPRFRADFLRFTSKSVEVWPNLPTISS
jgi:hypothetical protein